MRMMKASHSELKARFDKLADFNKKIVKLQKLFSNYFVNAVEISNVLSLASDSSELSDTKMTDDSNTHITDTTDLNSSDAAEKSVTITSSNSLRKTSVKKIMK